MNPGDNHNVIILKGDPMTHSDPTTRRPSRVGRALAIACVLGLATALLPAAANAATSPTLTITSVTTNATSGTVDTIFVFTVTTNGPANSVGFSTDDLLGGAWLTKAGDTNAPGSTVNAAKTVWTIKTTLGPGTRVLTFVAQDANFLPSPSKTLTIPVKGLLLVGLGESFAVGLGAGNYQNDGTNCYRSANAYTRLLGADTTVAVPLAIPTNGGIDGFQACSGAKIPNILKEARVDTNPTINSKIPEFGADVQRMIGNEPTLVVMSLGGNDVNYEEYMVCLGKSTAGKNADIACEPVISAYLTPGLTGTELFNDIIKNNLATLYNQMLDLKPNIKILVVGYPLMTKNEPSNVCGVVLAGTRARLYNLETSLNAKINAAVNAAAAMPGHAGRIFYVDPNAAGSPWIGHDLCSANPYFNKFLFSKNGPFHPNADGHQAYATVIKNWIAGHVAQLTK